MKLVLLVVALGCAVAVPVEDWGVSDCPPHSRPWLVYLSAGCSGALINEWWVLTSFLCQVRPYHTVAHLGEHDRRVEEGTEQRIQVARAVPHSPYRSPTNDLQLVQLAQPARFNSHVQPVALPTRCPHTGEECEVAGWGPIHLHQSMTNMSPLPLVEYATATTTLPPITATTTLPPSTGKPTCPPPAVSPSTPQCLVQQVLYNSHNMFYAGNNCLEERGSPIVCGGQLQGIRFEEYGADGPPQAYSRLCLYLNWIYDVMNSMDHSTTTAMPLTTFTT